MEMRQVRVHFKTVTCATNSERLRLKSDNDFLFNLSFFINYREVANVRGSANNTKY